MEVRSSSTGFNSSSDIPGIFNCYAICNIKLLIWLSDFQNKSLVRLVNKMMSTKIFL